LRSVSLRHGFGVFDGLVSRNAERTLEVFDLLL
jgi:hypothetical protein